MVNEVNQPSTPIVEHSAPEKSNRSSSASSVAISATKDDEITSLKKAAELGDAESQYKLGMRYDLGHGVEENKNEAFVWYRKAAELGHAKAQFFMGDMYCRGEGVEVHKAKAVEWFHKAAEKNHAPSQFNLAWMYQEGKGVNENKEKAFLWFHKSAEQGISKAQLFLSKCYQDGTGTEKILPLATYWYLKFLLKTPNTTLSLKGDQELIKLIPDTLKNHSIFKQLKVIRLFAGESLTNEAIALIASFIRSNPSIESLKILVNDVGISNDQASELAEALKFNAHLTRLQLKDNESSVENLYSIQPLLIQNRNIAELRKYVKDHPLITSSDIPVDVIKILEKQIIVSCLKSGKTKEATRKAIDEFLIIAGTTPLAKDSKIT
jgi:hypothetical protein